MQASIDWLAVCRAGLETGRRRRRVPPPTPTETLPGTPEKVRVLAARYRSGFLLWHPADFTKQVTFDIGLGIASQRRPNGSDSDGHAVVERNWLYKTITEDDDL